ncbi:putative glutamine--tRNA ligase [Armadillidium nasatum]|uniref:Putative glutamine--tRNA ligase n=1 Tax=Armadillidium nasatum TaxID=96803 RepID=A0A5N5SUZ3_9CRUS|nr:putative glutamine--tRNA ligase [Armadillidium nasatum]
MWADTIFIVIISICTALFGEGLTWLLVYRTEKYQKLKAEVERQCKKLEKKKESHGEMADRQQKKKIEREEEKLKNSNRDLSMVKMKSMFAIGFAFTALLSMFNSIFDGRVVAKLPFTPLSWLQGLSHRNLLGQDYTDCSFIFLYILCTMSIRQRSARQRGDGIIYTRFPPEPNGHLHIGHVKALSINFNTALNYDGRCILRFDDTNPETANPQFYQEILEAIEWLGYKPYKITNTSDYFEDLFDMAFMLIKQNLAYVCHEAVLRLKFRSVEGFIDPVAYRINFTPHCRTGTRWKVYPTYDFAHCICDSMENIAISLCSKEFENHRVIYEWVLKSLDLPMVEQREYCRLNIPYNITSKSSIKKITHLIDGYDDPRLLTIAALRRRGFSAQIVREFVSSGANDYERLHEISRNYFDSVAPRCFVVFDPLECHVINFKDILG